MKPLLALLLVAAACATSTRSSSPSPAPPEPPDLEELVPLVYAFDRPGPIVFRQWPRSMTGDTRYTPTYGVAYTIDRDRATLLVDTVPLYKQLESLPAGATAAEAARHLRVKRWDFDAKQCPAIPSLYEDFMKQPWIAGEQPEPPYRYGFQGRQELEFKLTAVQATFTTYTEMRPYSEIVIRAWRELDACSKR